MARCCKKQGFNKHSNRVACMLQTAYLARARQLALAPSGSQQNSWTLPDKNVTFPAQTQLLCLFYLPAQAVVVLLETDQAADKTDTLI